jgi:hypothetical protein
MLLPGWHATTDFETFEMETIWITGGFRTINLRFRSCMLPCSYLTSKNLTLFCLKWHIKQSSATSP